MMKSLGWSGSTSNGESLKRCRDMLHDYQAKLAANSNDPEASNEADHQTASEEG
jgi:hypothetical protein